MSTIAKDVWSIGPKVLKGAFKEHEYGLVILPMMVVKRFHDCLLPTHDAVLAEYNDKKDLAVIDGFLRKASGYQYYNLSHFTFDLLCADPESIETNLHDYLNGFSENVRDVLAKFKIDNTIQRLSESGILYQVIKEFNTSKMRLGSDIMDNQQCGDLFSELIRYYFESFSEDAKVHFTTPDITDLMVKLLLEGVELSNKTDITVYDMAMCTSQLLSWMEKSIHERNSQVNVLCYGQGHEENTFTFALAKADMMIREGVADNVRFGNTLVNDRFPRFQFDFIISNPPLGDDWKKEKDTVLAERKRGEDGRFSPGITRVDDSQLLFLLNGLSKMNNSGKMAILQNGSALFDSQVGAPNIRKYIIEHDWLETIIQLPSDLHLFTGLNTFIWILNKNKPENRVNQIQLVDASHCYNQLSKPIGKKRYSLTEECCETILKAYRYYQNDAIYGDYNGIYCHSKVFSGEEFGYHKITVERPKLDAEGMPILNKGKKVADADRRETEYVPLKEDIDAYFAREVLPYASDAWIDEKSTKIEYEIPFTRLFYRYQQPESIKDILGRLSALEKDIYADFGSILEVENL